MWIWTCPDRPGVISEHHSEDDADIYIGFHERGNADLIKNVKGYKYPLDKGCSHIHIPVDDGLPCFKGKSCSIPYVV